MLQVTGHSTNRQQLINQPLCRPTHFAR